MATLFALPSEILYHVVSQLLLPDQAALASTCKLLNEQLTPIVWKEVELHHRGVHEGLIIWLLLDEPVDDGDLWDQNVLEAYPFADCILQPSDRKYAQCETNHKAWRARANTREMIARERAQNEAAQRATDNCNRKTYQYGREEIFLGVRRALSSPSRWAELAAHVQSLCMSIAVDEEVYMILASLTNLRALQLVGLPLEEEWGDNSDARATSLTYNTPGPSSMPTMKFPALRSLRLRGYIPTKLVREIIANNASRITHLDLGLLAGPREDKVNAILSSIDDSDDDDSDLYDLVEDDDEKRPWALHSPHWLQGESCLPAPLSSLTHLRLVKPYNGITPSSSWTSDSFDDIPDQYDEVIYQEWAYILNSAASTLKEAIFEHRVAMEAGDTVGDGDPNPERKGSSYSTRPDRADIQFCEIIVRRLLVGGYAQFPHLLHLALRGIRTRAIQTLAEEVGSDAVPGIGDVPSNEERLRSAFPACDVELFEPAYPVHVYAGSIYQHWSNNRHEAAQDAGDGLLHSEEFYNDYRRRFGPDWRIDG